MRIEHLYLQRSFLWAQLPDSAKSVIGLIAQCKIRPFLQEFFKTLFLVLTAELSNLFAQTAKLGKVVLSQENGNHYASLQITKALRTYHSWVDRDVVGTVSAIWVWILGIQARHKALR